jgi:hypothetical protein
MNASDHPAPLPPGGPWSPPDPSSPPDLSSPADPELTFEALYDELLHLARCVGQGRASETMSTTVLVHEAYVRLSSSGAVKTESRLHFLRLAARAMRQILVDAARAQLAGKRGGSAIHVTLVETASALDIAPRTVKRDWRVARAFLASELAGIGS